MALALSLLAVIGFIFIAALLADGVRVLLARRRHEAAARPLDLVVSERQESAGQLVRLTLACARGGRLPAFSAGQHVLLQAPAGRQGKSVRRAYSLAAWTKTPRHYELGIKREAKGQVSAWAWENLKVGSRLALLPPRGDFILAPQETGELVLIAGGIGITPLRAMLHATLAADRERRIVLFHAARSATELLYHDEFQTLAARPGNFSYRPLVSRPAADWIGESGRLDALRILAALHTPAQAAFYLCANGALMDALHTGLLDAGIDATRVHWEAFGVAVSGSTAGQRIALEADGRRHDIVSAGEPTLLATLEAHDLAPASECRAGNCGQCCMRLVGGEVRWLMKSGIALADGEILPCICTATGDLRLAAPY
jgi:ferredoxin-NADP reductase